MDDLRTAMRPTADTNGPPPQALAALYQQHSRMVLSAAFRVTGSRQDAEDVLQTVFLRLTRRWKEIELTESVAAYLRRAAVNGSLDLLRSRSRAGSIPFDDLALEPAAAGGGSTERTARDGEFRRELRRALLDIPDQRARIFALRYFEGLPNGEIATLLGMSRVAVAVALHRTRRQLQSKLQQFVEGGTS
jgi:RNA polymerase sigma-70 factor (ECF subfamily)